MARRILKYEGKTIGMVSDQLFRPSEGLNAFELRLAFVQAMVQVLAARQREDLTDEELLDRSLKVLAPGRGFDTDRQLSSGVLSSKYGLPHALVVKRLGMPPETGTQTNVWASDSEANRREAREQRIRESEEAKKSLDDSRKEERDDSAGKDPGERKPDDIEKKDVSIDPCPDYLKTVVENELFHWCNWLGNKEILLNRGHVASFCLGKYMRCPKRKF